MQRKGKQKNNLRNKVIILNVIYVLFFVILVICFYKIGKWAYYKNKSQKNISSVIEDVEVTQDDGNVVEFVQESQEESVEVKQSDYTYYSNIPFLSVSISKLKEKNSDSVGWININGTNINYPIVKAQDNSYYLIHSFDKSYNPAGWIFLDYRCDLDNLRRNTIIYGHNRLDNTLFGSLANNLNNNWYSNKENRVIRIVTENKSYVWQIFSTYQIAKDEEYLDVYFTNVDSYKEYIQNAINRSTYNFDTQVLENDNLLTLSTCSNDTKNRVVVHAKLLKVSYNK